jgi:TonB-linked SusC/RagA family outer membrane protein
MRKMLFLLLTALMVFSVATVFSQTVKVRGTVVSSSNEGVPNATVTVKGTNRATQTDPRGNFTIEATRGEVLVLTSVSFLTKEYTVSDNASPRISLSYSEGTLGEVVITALDIKRNPRELGYSVQKVSGQEIKETQRENFVNGLAGRVAGLTVNPTSGTAGASSSVVLRGFNSLSLSNQPLFVVDGVILDNQTLDENSDGGRGIGLASDRPNRNNDYTNRISDINPNDIESVTVLKGPEATALYGSQASSGAMIITLRKAKSNKLAIQYDNAFRVEKVTRFPEKYDAYQNGTNGVSSPIYRYFGQPYPENTRLFNNTEAFFQPGFAQTHNLGMDFGVKNSVFRVSGSIFDQKGVIPENTFKRINFRISNTTKIGDKIDIIPSLAYVNSQNNKVLRSAGGFMLSLLVWPNTNSILDYEDENGGKLPLFNANPNADYDNPFFSVNKNQSRDVTDRYTASLGINLRPTDWLSIAGRFGYDTYNTNGYTVYHPQSFFIAQSLNGSQDNYFRRYRGYNHTITATAKKKVGDFNFRMMLGTMWQDYETKQFAITGNNLTDSKRSDTSNTAANTRVRLLRNNFGEFNQQILRQVAYFGELAMSYKNMAFLSYTHRFESASTLPEQNRNYNYPGVSLSLIVSDMIPVIRKGDVISYFKLRTSLAGTARLNTPYSTQSVFVNNQASGGGFSYGFTNANPDLKPERQQTYEVGAEMRFMNNRFGFDATYYNTLNEDQIIENFRLSYGTGFVLNTQNAASTRNTGVEIAADASIVSHKNFGWNLRLNFNKMWNKVIKMPPNVAEYYIADTWLYGNARGGLSLNYPTTSITSYGYTRNVEGKILINPLNGLPVIDQTFKVRGDRNPDFTLGMINSFRYKNWSLSFLWDLKIGGDIFNATQMYLTNAGRSKLTADRFSPRVIEGVLNDGKQNTATPTANTIAVIPAFNDAYYTATGTPEEAFIEKDVNWLRMRDLTLAYSFSPSSYKNIRGMKNLELFMTANDLVLITNYTGADPAVNGNTAGTRGVGAFGFDYGTLSTPIGVNFGVRVGF